MKKSADIEPLTIDDFFAPPDVHKLRREKEGGFMTALAALIVFVAECLFVYWTVSGQMALSAALVLHALIVLALGFYARALVKRGTENRYTILLLLTTAATGPFGPAGVILSVLLGLWFTRRSHHFAHWFDTIFPRVIETQSQRIFDDMQIGRDESRKSYSVIPFLDILSFGSEMQKRQALAKMTSNFNPNFAPAFRKALSDRSNTIRVQAATAITKIENQFMHRLMQLSDLKEKHADEPIVVLALASHCDDYAYTGLLDSDREQANRQRALIHYQEYLELKPRDLNVRTRIGRILMREKDYEKAYGWFRQCMELGYASDTINQWYSEALFSTARYEELRRFSATYKLTNDETSTPPPPALSQAIALWSTGGRA